MKWIVDRIEKDIAVCELEDGSFLDINCKALPVNVREGDVITLCIDKAETENRKEKIDKLMNNLFKS